MKRLQKGLAPDLEDLSVELTSIRDLLAMLTENLWNDAYQKEDEFDANRAKLFSRRLHLYDSGFSEILFHLDYLNDAISGGE